MRAIQDRYGFLFWLRWILWFAGSFILAALCWTALMKRLFGAIQGPELTLGWIVAVFGSWFILVIPFMRKKEQIWKRLNQDQERAVDAWFMGMSVFIGLLLTSCLGWSFVFKDRLHSAAGQGMDPVWAKAVFGSWLVTLLPFLVLMYRNADKIFKQAVDTQTYIPNFKSIQVDETKRLLPHAITSKIRTFPQALPGGHVVTAILKNGERVSDVFILNYREILGLYDHLELHFQASDIDDVQNVETRDLPAYEESRWLRLDGKV